MHACYTLLRTSLAPGTLKMDGTALFISRSLSYSVIALSFCMKFPQIIAILSSKHSKGVNVRGYWMEIGSYLIGASYGYFNDFHISTYGEAILLAIQSCTIIFLALYYGKLWNIENATFALLTLVFVVASIAKIFPYSVLYILLLITLPLAAASKLAQVLELYRIKTQGDVSKLTWSLAAYGCAARLFTIIVEVKDIQVFLNFLVSLTLNVVIVLQCIYYGKPAKQELLDAVGRSLHT